MKFVRQLLAGMSLLPNLLRVARGAPQLWRWYGRLTLARMALVVLLAAPVIASRVEDLRDGDEERASTMLGQLSTSWEWAVSLAGPIVAAQWLVVAFTREFDDRISDALARTAGVSPEEPEPPRQAPKVRVEWKWVRKRMRRRLQVFFAALPGFILLGFFFGLLPEDFMTRALSSAVGALWGFYWLVVSTVSKSALGWTTEATAPPPIFIRGLARVPFFGWLARTWTRLTKPLFAPAEMVERHPLEFSGLTLMRLTGVVPLLALWWRPLVPVAVASILEPAPPAEPEPEILGDQVASELIGSHD